VTCTCTCEHAGQCWGAFAFAFTPTTSPSAGESEFTRARVTAVALDEAPEAIRRKENQKVKEATHEEKLRTHAHGSDIHNKHVLSSELHVTR
jgi:hypothetical protein